MLNKKLKKLLEKREFVSVATCDFKGRPNAAPKFMLKVEGDCVYLVDYIIGATWRNVSINPVVSLSFMDISTLKGYQVNGTVEIVQKGREYKRLRSEMEDKAIRLTTQHIIEDIRGLGKYDNFEVLITEKFIILKVKIYEVVEFGISGELKRRKG